MKRPILLTVACSILLFARATQAADKPWEEPQNTEQALNDPDRYAWRLFVALNWPADMANRRANPRRKFGENDVVVWEAWKLSSGRNDEVFLKDGVDPGPWLPGGKPTIRRVEDFESRPLQQALQPGQPPEFDPPTSTKMGVNENHMNREAYEFVRQLKLYNIEGQEKLYRDAVKLRDDARKKLEDEGFLLDESEWNPKLIDFPLAAKEVKAQWREIQPDEKPRYRWEEYIDEEGNKKLYGLTALHITTKDLPNWLWATFEHVDNPKSEGAEPWIVASRDSAAGRKGFPEGMGIEGTRWANYRLRGTQINFVSPTGKPTILANSQIEQGFQTTSSCITCHAMATIGPPLKPNAPANRLSIFQAVHGKVRVGPIGVPDPGLFEKKTITDSVIGSPLYVQGDFVWSLMRAKRKKRK